MRASFHHRALKGRTLRGCRLQGLTLASVLPGPM